MSVILREKHEGSSFTVEELREKCDAFLKKAKAIKAKSTRAYFHWETDPSGTEVREDLSFFAYDGKP